jgi:hypothetical protein
MWKAKKRYGGRAMYTKKKEWIGDGDVLESVSDIVITLAISLLRRC